MFPRVSIPSLKWGKLEMSVVKPLKIVFFFFARWGKKIRERWKTHTAPVGKSGKWCLVPPEFSKNKPVPPKCRRQLLVIIITIISVNEGSITTAYGSSNHRQGQIKLLHSPSSPSVYLNSVLNIAGLAAFLNYSALL